jgi:putative tryptophan/tyrosine transport system substrate-binding protein
LKPMLIRRRSFVWRAVIVAAGLGTARSVLAASELRVVVHGDSLGQRTALQAIQRRFGLVRVGGDPKALGSPSSAAVYVATNADALRTALAAGNALPLVSLFSSSERYWSALQESGKSRSRGQITGIFAEVSPLHQLQLIARIYERRVSVGVLLTEATAHAEPALRQAARETDLELQVERVVPNTDVLHALMRVSTANVLLAIPDRSLYTAANLRDILESTYRRGQPMIGFSTSMVAAGTLAAAYSSVDDTVAQLGEVIDMLQSGRVPEPQYPKYWRVAINESVARSLNVVINDAARGMGNRPREGSR